MPTGDGRVGVVATPTSPYYPTRHFHLFVWHRHRHLEIHPPRGRHTRGWHGHVWFWHAH